tara:strand:- start:287 stop:979 length:693 start_codon:yes stop_codon:yes gene_type:complete
MNQNEPKMNQNEPQMNQNEPLFKCDFCDFKFNTIPSKRRHEIHRCKENPDVMEKLLRKKDKKIKKLEKERNKMKKEIEKILTTVGNVTNSNINSNNVIVVNNYGQENTSYLKEDYLKNLLEKPFGAIPQLIKNIHFHPKHPENHNVKITNKKMPHALVWNDKIWETRNKKQVIEDLVDKGYMIMDTTNENEDDNDDENTKYIYFDKKYEDVKDIIEKDTEMLVLNESKKL